MDEALVKLAAQVRERHHVPGLALGVGQAGQSTTRCFGVTHVEDPQPVGPHTLFQLGSVTKGFTCAAIMRLVPYDGIYFQGQRPFAGLRFGDAPGELRVHIHDLRGPQRFADPLPQGLELGLEIGEDSWLGEVAGA